jgi:hypothetical protein
VLTQIPYHARFETDAVAFVGIWTPIMDFWSPRSQASIDSMDFKLLHASFVVFQALEWTVPILVEADISDK